MSHQTYFVYNGKILNPSKAGFETENRAFRYGDGIFETMRWYHGRIVFGKDHLLRLRQGMKVLQMNWPKGLNAGELNLLTSRLARINRVSGMARVRLQVWRKDSGFYAPFSGDSSYTITVTQLEKRPSGNAGLKVKMCPSVSLLPGIFSPFKTCNGLPYVMAGLYARKKKLDDCLLLNVNGNVTEAISSNLFVVIRNTCQTPPLSDGCVDGIMRKNLIRLMKRKRIQVIEKSISKDVLVQADELFLTNVIQGIRWVENFEGKVMSHAISDRLTGHLASLDESFCQG